MSVLLLWFICYFCVNQVTTSNQWCSRNSSKVVDDVSGWDARRFRLVSCRCGEVFHRHWVCCAGRNISGWGKYFLFNIRLLFIQCFDVGSAIGGHRHFKQLRQSLWSSTLASKLRLTFCCCCQHHFCCVASINEQKVWRWQKVYFNACVDGTLKVLPLEPGTTRSQ